MVAYAIVGALLVYHNYKDTYYVTPTLKGIAKVLERKDVLELCVFSIFVYPLSTLVLIGIYVCKLLGKVFIKIVDSSLAKSSSYKIRASKIALLKVGEEIKYIKYTNISVAPLVATIEKINEDSIKITCSQFNKTINKKNIILYKGELLIDLCDD